MRVPVPSADNVEVVERRVCARPVLNGGSR
jgi:hypothetical protein